MASSGAGEAKWGRAWPAGHEMPRSGCAGVVTALDELDFGSAKADCEQRAKARRGMKKRVMIFES